MASNYTQFSFRIDATPEQKKWIHVVHQFCSDNGGSVDDKPLPDPEYIAAFTLMEQCIAGDLGANVNIEDTDREGLWFHADECGDVEYTAELLSSFLTALNLDTILSFSWANTCSKMRLDEFDGGAVVISKDETRFLSPSRWIDAQVAEIKAAR